MSRWRNNYRKLIIRFGEQQTARMYIKMLSVTNCVKRVKMFTQTGQHDCDDDSQRKCARLPSLIWRLRNHSDCQLPPIMKTFFLFAATQTRNNTIKFTKLILFTCSTFVLLIVNNNSTCF